MLNLVDYSDSEDSSEEKLQPSVAKPASRPIPPASTSNFAIDKSNPRKIRINLQETPPTTSVQSEADGEPALKRARTAGTFSGFNALLPPPKRDAEKALASTSKPARKVFSLKTGAEPGFSRDSDAELRQLFAEQDTDSQSGIFGNSNGAGSLFEATKVGVESSTPKTGSAMMFKPLSVARNPAKKKKDGQTTGSNTSASKAAVPAQRAATVAAPTSTPAVPTSPRKINLFGGEESTETSVQHEPETFDENAEEIHPIAPDPLTLSLSRTSIPTASSEPQSLSSIASDLNLSASARRQLLGRPSNSHSTATAVSVINFNTDAEYAANEVLRASGEQVQHNPVRAIASGKHSLKQLVSAATGQKDALEESFASGRRNKKEAGNKYGW